MNALEVRFGHRFRFVPVHLIGQPAGANAVDDVGESRRTLRMGGAGVVLELRHFKEKEKKMSVKCWAYVAAESVGRGGSAATATLQKPTDRSGRRRKNFNKGEPDVRVSFR